MNSGSVAFHHFGCKVNFAEASALSRQFEEKGFMLKHFHEPADIYVISTCIVTATAEKKCRAAIRQAHAINPQAKIAVIGCYSELKAHELSRMKGVTLVLGHSGKFNLLEELFPSGISRDKTLGSDKEHQKQSLGFLPSYSYGDRTRSFLKIQDGCDYHCTYCTIPLARGRSRSDTIENVLRNAKAISSRGVKEIVLTGVNIGDFGKHHEVTFLDLILALDQLDGLPRVRISSIEPDLLSDEIIEFVGSSINFMPHFHIPLQSGSDKILKAMHRKYNRELYRSRVQKIRTVSPYACIAADVIVGFPGEETADFLETRAFIEELDISYLHIFPYSKRDHTPASIMEGMTTDSTKKERSEILRHISEKKKRRFYVNNMGRSVNVLFESDDSAGFMHGFSENYLKVKTPFSPELINRIETVRLKEMDEEEVFIY